MPVATPSPAVRPYPAQAQALKAFLAAHEHPLDGHDAELLCAGLPGDAKQAAKQLRAELAIRGIDIKHTHALHAVAVARGTGGFLGQGESQQYEVASWSPDAPGSGPERLRHGSFADAADDVFRRIAEQYEDDAPWVTLETRQTHLLLTGASMATGAEWLVLLAASRPDGSSGAFCSLEPLERFAERLRRAVEGRHGGWVDGMFDVPQAFEAASHPARATRNESELASIAGISGTTALSEALPPDIASAWKGAGGLTVKQWRNLKDRYERFDRRHGEPLSSWVSAIREELRSPRFEPERVDLAKLTAARDAAGLSRDELVARLGPQHRRVATDLREGKCSLNVIPRLAEALGIEDPNELLAPARSKPRIPLPLHTDIALWLSRLEGFVSEPEGAPQAPRDLAQRLRAFCAVPYEKRQQWDKRPPAGLEALNQEIRFAGLLVCAGMGVRFVRDLPLGWTRPSSVSILEFDRQLDVLTQGGQLNVPTSAFELSPERDEVTPEWLARFNAPKFSANDLLRYSDMVERHREPEADDKSRFTLKVFAGAKVFKNPEKAHAATVRMEALSRLVESNPVEPWVRKGRDGDDSLIIGEAAFEAAARCTLVDIAGRPGFDRTSFFNLCVKHSRKYA